MTHALKTWPEFFKLIESGEKTFEIRYGNDRKFRVGDTLLLQEYDPSKILDERYTGNQIEVVVTHIMNGWDVSRAFGLDHDFVIMSIKPKEY